jgi:carbon storage regulator CsrA
LKSHSKGVWIMLVLTRKLGEEVVIGDNIRLTVVAIRGDRVRLGITAGADVLILRAELCAPPQDLGPAPGDPTARGAQP